jgi:serine/threonine protein kinase
MTAMIGKKIAGRYVVRRAVGSGGFGAVYECDDEKAGKRVALKTLGFSAPTSDDPATYDRQEESIARFRREARAAGKIQSPHVVRLLDEGDSAETGLFMVLELLDGEDLGHRLARGPVDAKTAADWARQAAIGLEDAHAAGVVHRDLKPANLFLARDEGAPVPVVKIVDFGVSKVSGDPHAKDAITRAGTTMGTPQYMAPEQISGGTMDHRIDVWALGAVLYEMLAGRPAYPLLESMEKTFITIATTKPERLGKVAPAAPKPLVSVVEAAMQHDVEDRLPDVATLRRKLEQAMSEAFPDERRAAAIARLQAETPPERSIVRTAILVVLVLLAVGGGVVFWLTKH